MAVVTVSEGTLRGGEASTTNGVKYYEFHSVPYAKPPVGDLRFKSPQPAESWEGERDATSSDMKNTSCQFNVMDGATSGSEDCLYLNVYTPSLSPDWKLLPVLVYIHGGGFIFGMGNIKPQLEPDFILDNEVVVVTINYRLGLLGFLNLEIPEVSGNMGLKDQVLALQWIQKNIHHFNGDKNNVTLHGTSAGASSVEYLMLSPRAKGLFHKAIHQSGSALNDWAINLQYKELCASFLQLLGYEGDREDKYSIYKFLLDLPATKITTMAFKAKEAFGSKIVFFGFVPTIEKDFGDAFLMTHPYKLLKEGNFNKVPIIKGFCDREGFLMNMMKPLTLKELVQTKNFADYLCYDVDGHKDRLNNEFRKYYTGRETDDEEDAFAIDYFGDLHFIAGVLISLKQMVHHGVPAYVYRFAYDGKLNFLKNVIGLKRKGAAHGDDIGYIFGNKMIPVEPTESDILMKSRIAKMFANFAKTSNPNSKDIPVGWPKYTEESKQFLNIDKELEILSDYEPDRMAIFEEIYDLSVKLTKKDEQNVERSNRSNLCRGCNIV